MRASRGSSSPKAPPPRRSDACPAISRFPAEHPPRAVAAAAARTDSAPGCRRFRAVRAMVEVEIEMGVWSFVKDAGKKLFGGEAEAAEVPEAVLKKEIETLGLDASGLDIKVEGDKVRVAGKAVSPEMKEKVILAVGNVEGVAKVETHDDADTGDAVFHTVQKGDTLSAIAKKTLGNANRYTEIFEANKPMLKHPDKIYPGQVLRIPKK